MGGHGGLNILPQKSWNVYNYENREKVRRDEEAAAKEEQLKRQQSRKRDAEFRLERLRSARGLSPLTKPTPESDPTAAGPAEEEEEEEEESRSKNQHINLFEGIKIFDPVKEPEEWKGDKELKRMYKKAKKEEVRAVTAEDEKYRMGYGLAGKGVKLPWYLERRRGDDDDRDDGDEGLARGNKKEEEGKKGGKKTLKELREERLKREQKEKERERALLQEKSRRDGGFSRRR